MTVNDEDATVPNPEFPDGHNSPSTPSSTPRARLAVFTRDHAKARARAVRAEAAATGAVITHAAALERVAAERGFASWNALSAHLAGAEPAPLQPGDQVTGRYLAQPFAGTVVAVRTIGAGAGQEVTIAFDAPVDVVRFESFENLRLRVTVRLAPSGVSFAKTGDGAPHLEVTGVISAVV